MRVYFQFVLSHLCSGGFLERVEQLILMLGSAAHIALQVCSSKSAAPLPAACISVHTCVVSNITKVQHGAPAPQEASRMHSCCLEKGARLLPARQYSCTRRDTGGQIGTDRATGEGVQLI